MKYILSILLSVLSSMLVGQSDEYKYGGFIGTPIKVVLKTYPKIGQL